LQGVDHFGEFSSLAPSTINGIPRTSKNVTVHALSGETGY